jgi:hypothetical protein
MPGGEKQRRDCAVTLETNSFHQISDEISERPRKMSYRKNQNSFASDLNHDFTTGFLSVLLPDITFPPPLNHY